ncbi:ankyrin repeat domain-containing protein [Ottowia thiooxydans]|uniref:Ankyrin repeat protein n=1 Tax=Ottowia thiooxydans TaxID=219182 RepID=A0ABV2QC59_9BURK
MTKFSPSEIRNDSLLEESTHQSAKSVVAASSQIPGFKSEKVIGLLTAEEINLALMVAAHKDDTDAIQKIAQVLDNPAQLNTADECGFTPLMIAARAGHTDTVELLATLLETPAAINAADIDGYTALMIAALNGYTDTVEVLAKRLGSREAINAINKDGRTALELAVDSGNVDTVHVLTEFLKAFWVKRQPSGMAESAPLEVITDTANLL